MADSLGPRVPPVPGRLYGSDRRRTQAQIRQLQRPRVTIPRAAASGGGIVGQAEIWASSGTVKALSGDTQMRAGEVTYDAPYDPNGGATPWWLSASGDTITLEPGWYAAVLWVRLDWSTEAAAPSSFDVYMGGGFDQPHLGSGIKPRTRNAAAQWGIRDFIPRGEFYAPGSSEPDYLLKAQVFFPGMAAGADTAAGSLIWTITKYA